MLRIFLLIVAATFTLTNADYLLVESFENTECTGAPSASYASFLGDKSGCALSEDKNVKVSEKLDCSARKSYFYSDTKCYTSKFFRYVENLQCLPSTQIYPQFGFRESKTCVYGEYTVPQGDIVISQIYAGASCVEYPESVTHLSNGTCMFDPQSNEYFTMLCGENAVHGMWFATDDCKGASTRTLDFPYGCSSPDNTYPDPWGRGDKQIVSCSPPSATSTLTLSASLSATSSLTPSATPSSTTSARVRVSGVSPAIIGGAVGGALAAVGVSLAATFYWRSLRPRSVQEHVPLLRATDFKTNFSHKLGNSKV